MPRASAADAARTAERIRDCALGLFAEHGYAAVALEDVAHAARVTRGAVYHHFRNKDGLFRAVAEHLHETVASRVATAAEKAGPDPEMQLKAGSHAFLEAIPAHVKELLFWVKRYWQPSWGQDWRSHFSVSVINGRKGNALRLDGEVPGEAVLAKFSSHFVVMAENDDRFYGPVANIWCGAPL